MIRQALLAILTTTVFCACNGNGDMPANVLKPDKMQAVMWDILRADVFTSEFIKVDTSKNLQLENLQLQKKIFALNKTTREQYYRSFDYYKTKPDLMRDLLDTMAARVNRNRSKGNNPIPGHELKK